MGKEAARSYRPGSRRPDLRAARDGLMSESRWAWVKNVIGQFVIMGDETPEVGMTIRLFHPTRGRPVDWNLTALTEEELLSMREIFNAAFDWALPEVQRRDKEAHDAFTQGDDSHARVYRQTPQLVYRKRPERQHSKGVSKRPAGASEVSSDGLDHDGELRGQGDDLAEHDTSPGSPEDHWPKIDQPPKL